MDRLRTQNILGGMLILLMLSATILAQEKGVFCSSTPAYQNQNQLEVDRWVVNHLKGQATDANSVGITGLCVALFTEKKHRLIATTVTGKDGFYKLGNIRPGQYRLVIQGLSYCPANGRVMVVPKTLSATHRQRLYAHMRAGGIHDCSYINNTRPYIENGI